jgi:hypothetical protein
VSGGALQISLQAEYVGGKDPNPNVGDLIDLARGHGESHEAGELVETFGGSCSLGEFGSAIFSSAEFPHTQLWYLTNGLDFVLATFVCTEKPGTDEIAEAQEIVSWVELTKGSAD